MFVLGKIANDEQVERFLVPVIDGRQRSVFAMTEPGGAGSDQTSWPPRRCSTAAST